MPWWPDIPNVSEYTRPATWEDVKKVDATYLQGATVPLNITGLPGISMRFGTGKEGMPINVQIVGSWLAESTILHIASLLESVSPVRDLHPKL